MIKVRLEPDGVDLEFHGLKTVLGLLNKLGLRPTMALVIREDRLLTADIRIKRGDEILVRKVTSAG
ncbi:hypothetical protein [Salidesulfovibrio onnuriiensis]|uniref:hypothetical protein n=1 Tax=Salidesulfovibrio onnuriiensis TaxID=2583823 RepID=UPI0011C877B5|nr:hypothetical protein [Salidesulfovibrio onnuriiensis]